MNVEECMLCGAGIDVGERYFSLNYHDERFVNENEIEVITADCLATLCYDCGYKVKLAMEIPGVLASALKFIIKK